MTSRTTTTRTDTTVPALSIVVPVFNGAPTVAHLVQELSLLKVEGGMEVVLVNDGSADNSADICRDLVENATVPVTFVDLSRNYGEHNAIMAGLHHATGDHIITMGDDLQNPPEEVTRLYYYAVAQDYDVTYTRFRKKEHQAWRNWGSRLANQTANYVLDKPREIYLSSFRCLKKFVKDAIICQSSPFPHVDGLIFQVTQNVGALEVEHLPNMQQRHNYTLRRLVHLWISILVGFSVKPLRISTILGALLTFTGFLGGGVVFVQYAMGVIPVQGWASIMVVTLIFSGVQLLILGLIGEYVGRIYMTENGKPQFVVREVYLPSKPKGPAVSKKVGNT